MTRAPLFLLLRLFAALALLVPAATHADPSDIAAAARSVVRVVLVDDDGGQYSLQGHGSGFAVAPDMIVTNAHVVEAARQDPRVRIGIVPSEGKSGYFAKIVAISPEKDLALLKLTEAGSLAPATLFTGAVTDGEDVVAVGYPGNVDLAQGLNVGDIVSPTTPVKTRGNVSSGRSSKAFETILHTAPLGAGNSGGPLLDQCGRVLGANSFGTESTAGDSEFYFAVSTREILRFLIAFQVQPRTIGSPCRSIADLDRVDAERSAGDQARAAEAQRDAAARSDAAQQQALHQALFEIAGERENWLGIAGMALLLALGCGTGAWLLRGDEERPLQVKLLAAAAVLLLIGGVAAMFLRPGFDQVDSRAKNLLAPRSGTPSTAPITPSTPLQGQLVCTIDPDRSRVTVSDMSDVTLQWAPTGCADGKTQFAFGTDGWSQIDVPDSPDTATTRRFDPARAQYRVERTFLDHDSMEALRTERKKISAPACGAGEDAARRYGDALGALKAMLPTPNERLVYNCVSAAPAPHP
jgi:S1-C subfamily serine protease